MEPMKQRWFGNSTVLLTAFGLITGALLSPQFARSEPPNKARPTSAQRARQNKKNVTMDARPYLQSNIVKTAEGFDVDYTVHAGEKAILVYNRLRAFSEPEKRDDQSIYRFVVGKSLRLLLGAAPLPTPVMVDTRNTPQVVKVEAYRSFHELLHVRVPVTEHSCYFTEPEPGSEQPLDEVQDVTLFVEYTEAQGVKLSPSTVYPDAFEPVSSVERDNVHRLQGATHALQAAVRRRTDMFARLLLGSERDPYDWLKPTAFPL